MTLFIAISFIAIFVNIAEMKLHIPTRLRKLIFPITYGILIMISQVHTKVILSKPNIYLLIGSMVIGYLCYIVSMLIVGTKFNIHNLLFNTLNKLSGKIKNGYRKEILNNLYTSSLEEFLYRGILQVAIYEIINNFILTIILSTILFSVVHYFQDHFTVQKIDIAVFSLIITLYFQITNDIWSCILIHIFRNWFVINQKYVYLLQKQYRITHLANQLTLRKPLKEGGTFNE